MESLGIFVDQNNNEVEIFKDAKTEKGTNLLSVSFWDNEKNSYLQPSEYKGDDISNPTILEREKTQFRKKQG